VIQRFRQIAWFLSAVMLGMLLYACAGKPPKEADQEPMDGPSTLDLRPEDVADALPKAEPLARYGNHSPYEVFGKTYRVLPSSKGYHEKGIASWYGSKFHGRRTSSGEPYDMHLATAAHKTLPLPTYAEVTNLDNGRKVIVKINDRGPFKDDRLIDMSYGAALRLGMTETGTARVELRVIDVEGATTEQAALKASDIPGTFLQAGAFSRRKGAEDLAVNLENAKLLPVSIQQFDGLFRVWLGPYTSSKELESVIGRAIELGFERPHTVRR
jgi:rare lipoprotein A